MGRERRTDSLPCLLPFHHNLRTTRERFHERRLGRLSDSGGSRVFFFLIHLNSVGSILEMLGEILVIYAVYLVDELGLV